VHRLAEPEVEIMGQVEESKQVGVMRRAGPGKQQAGKSGGPSEHSSRRESGVEILIFEE
jgi:hypothetical protein